MPNPNAFNEFTLRGKFVDRRTGSDVDIPITGAANAVLNDISGIGKVTLLVCLDDGIKETFQTTSDGQSDFVLDGTTFAMLWDTDGPYVYFTLWGGLPAGNYLYWFEYQHTTSGVIDRQLSTKEKQLTVSAESVTFGS